MKKAAMIVVLALSVAVMGGLVSDQASAQCFGFGRGAAVVVGPAWGCAPAWGWWGGCWPGYCAPAPCAAPKAAKAKAKEKK
jgi:hypothetical protein